MKKLLTRALVGAMLVGGSITAIDYTLAQNADKPNKADRAGRLEHRTERHDKMKNMTLEQRVDKRLEQMKKNLALTDAQAAQIRAILIEDGNRMKQAHEARNAAKAADQQLTKEQRQAHREAMKAQRLATKERIAALLNAEQKAKMEAQKDKRKEKMMKHMKRHRGDGVQRNSPEMQKELKQNRQKAK